MKRLLKLFFDKLRILVIPHITVTVTFSILNSCIFLLSMKLTLSLKYKKSKECLLLVLWRLATNWRLVSTTGPSEVTGVRRCKPREGKLFLFCFALGVYFLFLCCQTTFNLINYGKNIKITFFTCVFTLIILERTM